MLHNAGDNTGNNVLATMLELAGDKVGNNAGKLAGNNDMDIG